MNGHAVVIFFEMGGYAPFVWGAYGVTALLMVVEPLLAARRRRRAIAAALAGVEDAGRRGSTLIELVPGTVLR